MDHLLLESSPFHNPRLDLSEKFKEQKIYELVRDLVLPVSKIRKLMDTFTEEMRVGLMARPPRDPVFYMCNTFVVDHPDGTEEGDFLGMDLGGSNLRIHLARLKPGTEPQFISQAYEVDRQYRTGTVEKLFDFLGDSIADFINKVMDIRGKRLPFGFTFSFGFENKCLDIGIIKEFSLQTPITNGVGDDAVQLLSDAIKRKGLNVDVVAILNDTSSTLTYGMFLKPETQISLILGSGTNTGYIESVGRMEKLDPMKTFGNKVEKVVVNCETGYLGDNGSIDFVKTKWDKEIDEESMFPHKNGFEKLVGGLSIGDLVRRVLLCLAKNNVFLSGVISEQLNQKDSIKGPDVSSVESESIDGPVIALLNRLGYSSPQITRDDIAIVRYVCALIGVRNAHLIAANLSAVAQHIGKPLIRVAVDGSVYKKHPKLHLLITDFIAELLPKQKVELFLADEGSGKGSALIAAVVERQRQKSR